MLVPLTKGMFAVIDAADAVLVAARRWYLQVSGPGILYARSNGRYLHHVLWESWGQPKTRLVDHRDGNGLDCRRQNVRAATRAQNNRNSRLRSDNRSGFKGVTEVRPGRFRAQCRFGGRNQYLGRFDTPEEAHAAYVAAAREHAGEFARAA